MRTSAKILHVDLSSGESDIQEISGREMWLGGCGLAACLFERFGDPAQPPSAPAQPLIFAIGPLTGYFPLQSKVVAGFVSPYTGQYAESHAGGRLGLALRFSGFEALVVTGRASTPSCLIVGSRQLQIKDVHYLWGHDVFSTGKLLRQIHSQHSGHRSILRIGPAGEQGVAYAAINVDTYRHFGRLGAGAVMGGKHLKGIIVAGDASLDLPKERRKSYNETYTQVHHAITGQDVMRKYHDLGTPENLEPLNALQALPWRNLQATNDPAVSSISGETFARDLLLRQTACAGCPVGCIHVGLLRERFGSDHEFFYRQVSYDYEPIFALGSMLGMERASEILTLLEDAERYGLDVISCGVALAWATEALEKGVVTEKETLAPLAFNTLEPYRTALGHLALRSNEFYHALGRGAARAAAEYGGTDFACVLGQEMAGYATGENYFVSQAYGFRHSHLDSGGYAYDQNEGERDVDTAVTALVDDERQRIMVSCMVGCLFARKVYTAEQLQTCLDVLGYSALAAGLEDRAAAVQAKRWALKCATGFDPDTVVIPRRFQEITTWKGAMDPAYMNELGRAYARTIQRMAANAPRWNEE
ncbi:aldehyde ferredoxin oxidoreductase N-terminal domain-containing protein [Desulfohalobium retbaense]|uniref:Aldehyde ferredoxin oxidoreductase n=1 Tax=Desulfohalobium retbaense (strain ATCC 49708 / DSM 5692 / JCM 16813 / HR100) TaxID=485915 RepID=C8WZA8_DESRD|nr:aldehyde ferredoxin oxidoreductase N-terminal domain-containing protein [Desulfohalobium retbaense]ACV67383.1 Aldehyde ferredoxin oxidoreductase [Desulfohalobium retbaense DSM 5692]